MGQLSVLRGTWSELGMEHAANFMYAFQYNLGLDGATNGAGQVTANSPGHTHNVGALFGSDGSTAPCNQAVFGPSSDLASDVLSSAEMRAIIIETLYKPENLQQVIDAFEPPAEPPVDPFTFAIEKAGISFDAMESPDLKYSIGHANMDLSISTVVVRVFEPDPFDPDWQIEKVVATNVIVTGTVWDLYDFDYDSYYVANAAMLQAGFGTLGSAGHVFRWEIQLDTSAGNFLIAQRSVPAA